MGFLVSGEFVYSRKKEVMESLSLVVLEIIMQVIECSAGLITDYLYADDDSFTV